MTEWPPRPELRGLEQRPGPDLRLIAGTGRPGTLPAFVAGPPLRIGVLGAFMINAEPAALHPAQGTLLLALALNPDGLLNEQLRYYLGADADHPKPNDSLRQLIVRTRRRLGEPGPCRQWIEHLGGGLYRLHPGTRFDWAGFRQLSEQGIAAGDRDRLRRALTLVRGRPFDGCYHWWLDVAVIEAAQAHIARAAAALTEMELAAGDSVAAVLAAWTGLSAAPGAETLWQVLLRAEHASGDLRGVRSAWDRYLEMIRATDPIAGPHPRTAALYLQLTGGTGAA